LLAYADRALRFDPFPGRDRQATKAGQPAHIRRILEHGGCSAATTRNQRAEVEQAGALIVCFNAPFDLSRLALTYRTAQKKNSGWSMVYWEYNGKRDKLKPMIRIRPKDSRSAFISLAGGDPENRTIYRGRFLDLSVFGWALRNKHMSLEGFLRSFKLKGKLAHEPTGKVSNRELAYG